MGRKNTGKYLKISQNHNYYWLKKSRQMIQIIRQLRKKRLSGAEKEESPHGNVGLLQQKQNLHCIPQKRKLLKYFPHF